eukprot:1195928-Prorocentrum_minimum.AAC.6
MLLAPEKLLEYMLVPFTVATPLFLRVLGAEASQHNRLGSNTYKRLNLGLVASAIGMMNFKNTAETVRYQNQ